MPKNYTMTKTQRAQRSTMLRSDQREFDNALRMAPTTAAARKISARSFSSNPATSGKRGG